MKWFGREKKTTTGRGSPVVQLRREETHPFSALDRYLPMQNGQTALYRSIREAVPIVDAAVWKLVRLCGGVQVKSHDPAARKGLEWFWENVDTGWGQRGIQSFLERYLDDLFTCGQGLGEIVPDVQGREIAAVLCADPAQAQVKVGESPLDVRICNRQGEELPYPELLLFTPFQPTGEQPCGVSLLHSMPFLTGILLKIFQATGQNWERAGNLRFAVVCKPGEEDGSFARDRCEQLAEEWSAAMQSTRAGAVRDFVAVGDVEVKVIGADGPVLDSQVPVRQILEQLVARTGIPPFMLGLSWSSTERMSMQQADMLTSEITAIRRSLEPMLKRIARLWLILHGYDDGVDILWDDINLQDIVEEAKADLCRAQAEQIREECGSCRT